MPKKTSPSPIVRTALLVTHDRARQLVYHQLDKGAELLNADIRSEHQLKEAMAAGRRWSDYTEELLEQIFNTDDEARKFVGHGATGFFSLNQPPLEIRIRAHRQDLEHELERLASLYERLELLPVVVNEPGEVAAAKEASTPPTGSSSVTIHNYGTINNPQIQQATTQSSQEILSVDAAALGPLLRDLEAAVENMSASLSEEVAAQLQRDHSVFQSEATSKSPRREWLTLSAEGLKKAATDIGDIGKPVLELVARILPLILALKDSG